MEKIVMDEVYGEISFKETFWLGKRIIKVNGETLTKIDKTTYISNQKGFRATLAGGITKGFDLVIEGKVIHLTEKITWYEWIIAMLPAIIMLTWGNIPAMVKIVPVPGGLIGGLLGGIGIALNIQLTKFIRKKWLRILTFLGITVGVFALGALIGLAIVSIANKAMSGQ